MNDASDDTVIRTALREALNVAIKRAATETWEALPPACKLALESESVRLYGFAHRDRHFAGLVTPKVAHVSALTVIIRSLQRYLNRSIEKRADEGGRGQPRQVHGKITSPQLDDANDGGGGRRAHWSVGKLLVALGTLNESIVWLNQVIRDFLISTQRKRRLQLY